MDSHITRTEIDKIRDMPIAFIVGCGRSGTTLFQSLANSHPNIVATPECLFVVLLYARFGNIRKWTVGGIHQFIDELYSLPRFAFWLLDREKLTKKLISAVEFADYSLLCKMVYYQMRNGKDDVRVLIDKNYGNSIFINKLLKIFPDGKFIHIVREPKDCVNAHIVRFKKKNTFFISWYWRGFNGSVEKSKGKLPGRFFTVLYENFVRNTKQTMCQLCDFLQIPFDEKIMETQLPQILSLHKDDKAFEGIRSIHEGLLLPVNDSNIGKWEKTMSKRDVAIAEGITGRYAFKKYGYAREEIKEHISFIKIGMSALQYYMWKLFTKLRFNNYRLNMYYLKRKAVPSPGNQVTI